MSEVFSVELLAGLRNGDDSAWSHFYDTLAPELRAYVDRLGASSPDDVVGETMVQVVRSLRSFRGTAAELRPWTFGIARNRVIDAGRQRQRRPIETALSEATDLGIDDAETDLDGDLSTMLENLTTDQRDAVWLRYVVGLSVDETAMVMARAPDAVAALTHRALRRLRAGFNAT